MPGAPNRPPAPTAELPAAPVLTESAQQKALRRLVPTRVALLLDQWKGAPSPDLLVPFEKAEHAYAADDYAACLNSVELLSVRFAEPRWPTLPEPFRRLRVPIPAPMPPHWNPDNALSPAEREALRARRTADDQLALAVGCLAWAGSHGVNTADLAPKLEEARTLLATEGVSAPFYERVDAIWVALRDRVPLPKTAGARAAPAAAASAAAEEA